jgi:hypothetical protein
MLKIKNSKFKIKSGFLFGGVKLDRAGVGVELYWFWNLGR